MRDPGRHKGCEEAEEPLCRCLLTKCDNLHPRSRAVQVSSAFGANGDRSSMEAIDISVISFMSIQDSHTSSSRVPSQPIHLEGNHPIPTPTLW
jgi:hypothetical protein